MKIKIKFGCVRLNIDNTGVATKFIPGQGQDRLLIVGDVKLH